MDQKPLPFTFDNGRGQKLAGLIDHPSGTPLVWGVFAPCFTCTKESHGAHKVCRALARRGVAMLRFDLTGLGASEGDFAETNFTTRIADIIAAARALEATHAAPSLLIGHSISGTAALRAVEFLPSVKVLATIGAPPDPRHVVDKLEELGRLTIDGEHAIMTIAGRGVRVRTDFIDNARAESMAGAGHHGTRPLLVFHAPNDDIVSFRHAATIALRAGANARVIPLSDTATHLFERGEDDAAFIADQVVQVLNPDAPSPP